MCSRVHYSKDPGCTLPWRQQNIFYFLLQLFHPICLHLQHHIFLNLGQNAQFYAFLKWQYHQTVGDPTFRALSFISTSLYLALQLIFICLRLVFPTGKKNNSDFRLALASRLSQMFQHLLSPENLSQHIMAGVPRTHDVGNLHTASPHLLKNPLASRHLKQNCSYSSQRSALYPTCARSTLNFNLCVLK